MELENMKINEGYMTGNIKYKEDIFGNEEGEITERLKRLSRNILLKYNYNISKEVGYNDIGEYHEYKLETIREINSKWEIHTDGSNFHNSCSTIIFYLENTFQQGGGLIIYDKDKKTIKEIINTKSDNGEVKMVLLDGKVPHNMESAHGIGIRRSYVFQYENNDEEFTKYKNYLLELKKKNK